MMACQRCRLRALACAVAALTLPGTALAQAQGYLIAGKAGGPAIQLRAGPGPGYPPVGSAPPMTPVRVDECLPVTSYAYSWCRVSFGRSVGWLSANSVVNQTTGQRPGTVPQTGRYAPPPQIRRSAPPPAVTAPPTPRNIARTPARRATARLYRVTKVRSWDELNIRSGPDHKTAIVGTIPANGRGIRRMGCVKGGKWCRVEYQGVKGWASGHFLAPM